MDWPDLTYSLNPTWPAWLPDGAAPPGVLGAALLVALRPSVGMQVYEGLEPSKLLIVVDFSKSMTIPDDFNSTSRWDHARGLLASRPVVDALKRLSADEQIEGVYYQGDRKSTRLNSSHVSE